MANIIQVDYGNLDGVNIKTGSFYMSDSVRSFDCGITDPDIVLVKNDRQANDWTWTYIKAGIQNFTYGVNTYAVAGTNIYTSDTLISVSGSTVSFSGTHVFGDCKWLALKFPE